MMGDGVLNLLARAVGNLQDAVLVTEGERGLDGARRIIFVNRAFVEMTGFSQEEAVGKLPDITVGPESDPDMLRLIQSAREALVPVRVELLKYRKDGTTFWAELDVVPVIDEQRRCTHFLGVMRDVTERRATHKRLLDTERLTTLGALSARVAHEMNNPLAYMMLNIGFLREELPRLVASTPEPSRWTELLNAVDEIDDGASRVSQIVHDISMLSLSKFNATGRCELVPLLERAVQMARIGIAACAPVKTTFGPLPLVKGDASRLAQVFLNLVLNALQSIPPKEVDRRGVEVAAWETHDAVIVEVRDEGVGVAAELLPRIFDPFFTTKDTSKGVGLGLSIAQNIVRSIGGQLKLESIVGTGTTVRVSLPRATSEPALAAVRTRSLSESRLRILVIDDEPLLVRSLARALKTRDDVLVANDGVSALRILESASDFDTILCDLSMPGMTGQELYATIASRWPGLERRFILMTGGPCSEEAQKFLEHWTAPRLDKPVDLAALRELLDRVREPRA